MEAAFKFAPYTLLPQPSTVAAAALIIQRAAISIIGKVAFPFACDMGQVAARPPASAKHDAQTFSTLASPMPMSFGKRLNSAFALCEVSAVTPSGDSPADETYRPSEAAHNSTVVPSIGSQGPPPSTQGQTAVPGPPEHPQPPAAAEPVRDERKETYEAAARKMDVDEDYDDEPSEDKRKAASTNHSSPRAAPKVAGPVNTEVEAN